jgi:uncharacterized SAM-binding protein YcdF (DUF218 family)
MTDEQLEAGIEAIQRMLEARARGDQAQIIEGVAEPAGGLPYEDGAARQIRQLKWLGVTDVVQIPRTDVGTEGEAQVLPPWCDQHQFQSIVLVAARDHSRRLRRVLDRAMKGHPTRVTVRPARYSNFDPDRWWETRGGVRTEIVALQKLVLDVVLHPMSF